MTAQLLCTNTAAAGNGAVQSGSMPNKCGDKVGTTERVSGRLQKEDG